ncbi:protein-export chaperone SecB [Terribacillus saccharophilus]|uniref:protein-export chaperone SecB n=1 Tax=Terribacillus saccharophilus TaxID=361277 RepID=UPI000C9CE379|nr:protein-export chaperone SecB [Terribacillus goriensis]
MSSPIIEFKGYSIKNLIYSQEKIKDVEFTNSQEDLEFDVSHGFTEDLSKAKLGMRLQLATEDDRSFLVLEVEGFFDINSTLIKNEDGSNREMTEIQQIFLVNSTAILYPYLRSIVSVVTSLDSANSIILPTINLRNYASKN